MKTNNRGQALLAPGDDVTAILTLGAGPYHAEIVHDPAIGWCAALSADPPEVIALDALAARDDVPELAGAEIIQDNRSRHELRRRSVEAIAQGFATEESLRSWIAGLGASLASVGRPAA